MIKYSEFWKYVPSNRDELLSGFDENNNGYFENEDDLIAHAIITLKKIYLVRNNIKFVKAIYYDSIAGMRYELGKNFSGYIINFLYPTGNLNDLYNILIKEHFLKVDKKEMITDYFIEAEYAIISLNLKMRVSITNKLSYLENLLQYYKSFTNEGANPIYEKMINFCESSEDLLIKFGSQLKEVRVEKTEIRDITFIDSSVAKQVYYIFIREKIDPFSKTPFIQLKDRDKLERFLNAGKLKAGAQVFFRGDAKTLAFCFYQLRKYNLINRVEYPDKQYSDKELAKIIFQYFKIPDCQSWTSIYDYLRKGILSLPLNPIFFIEKNDTRKSPFRYNFYKPKFRKKGTPWDPSNMDFIDPEVIEEIYQYDTTSFISNSNVEV